jgi:Integrase core domain
VDHGLEFVSKGLDQGAYRNGVRLDFSRSGKPTDNAYAESFNGSLRDECLNVNGFLSREDARGKIEAWRRHYNASRPHTALGNVSPSEFANQGGPSPALVGSARPGTFTPWVDPKRGDLHPSAVGGNAALPFFLSFLAEHDIYISVVIGGSLPAELASFLP